MIYFIIVVCICSILKEIAKRTLINKTQCNVIGGLISPVSERYEKPGLLPGQVRVELCRLGCEESDWIDVDDWESKQTKWVRTYETLQNLKKRLLSNMNLKRFIFFDLLYFI